MTPSQLHFWLRWLCQRANVQGTHATIHGFRHYLFGSDVCRPPVPVPVTMLMEDKRNRLVDVAEFIGHRSLATTTQYYWHVDIHALYERLIFPWSAGPPI